MIALSFDIEEFDVPIENGKAIDMEEQIRISTFGANRILDIMKLHGVKATFFCTVTFAEHSPLVIERIVKEGHEIASHGCYHSRFDVSHLAESRLRLEQLSGQHVYGYRMARMMPILEQDVAEAGYEYNSSINPTFIPGRYNNLNLPVTMFKKDGVVQIPTSVSPLLRLPLFWLAIHNFPLWIYKILMGRTIASTGSLVVYMHPWEFYNLHEIKGQYSLSSLMTRNCGRKLEKRLEDIITTLQSHGNEFVTMHELALTYTD